MAQHVLRMLGYTYLPNIDYSVSDPIQKGIHFFGNSLGGDVAAGRCNTGLHAAADKEAESAQLVECGLRQGTSACHAHQPFHLAAFAKHPRTAGCGEAAGGSSGAAPPVIGRRRAGHDLSRVQRLWRSICCHYTVPAMRRLPWGSRRWCSPRL